jgi:hypothetical protein
MILDGVVVSLRACHAGDSDSNLSTRNFFTFFFFYLFIIFISHTFIRNRATYCKTIYILGIQMGRMSCVILILFHAIPLSVVPCVACLYPGSLALAMDSGGRYVIAVSVRPARKFLVMTFRCRCVYCYFVSFATIITLYAHAFFVGLFCRGSVPRDSAQFLLCPVLRAHSTPLPLEFKWRWESYGRETGYPVSTLRTTFY